MLRRIWSLALKEFLHLLHDWWMPAFMLIGGTSELLLVGWATSRPISNLTLMVLDQDRTAASRSVITALENTDTFGPPTPASSLAAIEQAMDRGEVSTALVIPPGFGDALARCCQDQAIADRPAVALWLDGADSTSAGAAQRAAEGAIGQLGQNITIERLGLSKDVVQGFTPSLRVWYNEALSDALYTTPAELGLMLEFTVLLFAALSFARERELGTLEQLLVMPFSSLEIIVGKAIPAAVVGFADFMLMLGVIHFAFGVPVRGSLPLLCRACVGLSARRAQQGARHLRDLTKPTPGFPARVDGRHDRLHVHRLRRACLVDAQGAPVGSTDHPGQPLADHPARPAPEGIRPRRALAPGAGARRAGPGHRHLLAALRAQGAELRGRR